MGEKVTICGNSAVSRSFSIKCPRAVTELAAGWTDEKLRRAQIRRIPGKSCNASKEPGNAPENAD
jgi:hypothetical protein